MGKGASRRSRFPHHKSERQKIPPRPADRQILLPTLSEPVFMRHPQIVKASRQGECRRYTWQRGHRCDERLTWFHMRDSVAGLCRSGEIWGRVGDICPDATPHRLNLADDTPIRHSQRATLAHSRLGSRCPQTVATRQTLCAEAPATRAAGYTPGTAPDCGTGSIICGPPRSIENTARARRTCPSYSRAYQPSTPRPPPRRSPAAGSARPPSTCRDHPAHERSRRRRTPGPSAATGCCRCSPCRHAPGNWPDPLDGDAA
jgi:hypothetical protein